MLRAAQAVVFFLEERKKNASAAASAFVPWLAKCNNLQQQQREVSFKLSQRGRAARSAAAARAAALEASTPTPTHAHHTNRRGVFYIRQEAHGPPTDRPCMPLAFDVLGA